MTTRQITFLSAYIQFRVDMTNFPILYNNRKKVNEIFLKLPEKFKKYLTMQYAKFTIYICETVFAATLHIQHAYDPEVHTIAIICAASREHF